MRLYDTKSLLVLAGVGLILLTTSISASANGIPDPNPGVVPVDGMSKDKRSYSELAGDFWNWATLADLLDSGEVDCSRGQSGKVWFLAGNFGGVSERSCTIRKHKQLFFPIVNSLWWTPEDGDTVPEVRAFANGSINPVDTLMVEVNGVEVLDVYAYRAQSPAGGFVWNNDEFQEELGLDPMDRPSASDGYWILLDPLPKGEHTVRFVGGSTEQGFELDVTYHLTVTNKK